MKERFKRMNIRIGLTILIAFALFILTGILLDFDFETREEKKTSCGSDYIDFMKETNGKIECYNNNNKMEYLSIIIFGLAGIIILMIMITYLFFREDKKE